ncbi:PD-(D/E)XK nuclease family protein [Methanococcoides sp. SA1]|nr:PD-(D/E)XK nuclease family protein [Methanococcoides sp. SA1]
MENTDTLVCSTGSKISDYNDILEAFDKTKDSLTQTYLSGFKDLLKAFKPIKENAIEQNRMYSCNFNPLKQFVKLNETMHSKMLAYLLNPQAKHGQKDLFLQPFLRTIGVADPEKGKWVVTAEKDRVDIMLKRIEPNSVVIIENKSNGADDQPNQLYRYWHKEMFRNPEYRDDKTDYYKIVYLPGDESKTPCENSLEKPGDTDGYDVPVMVKEHDILPVKIPLDYNYITFENDIVDVLKECMKQLPKENHRLRGFVEQYVEIWN